MDHDALVCGAVHPPELMERVRRYTKGGSTMRLYAARTDANQPQIVRDIREVFGPDCLVDTSRVGGGFPDLVLGVRGRTILLEIKGAKGKLTPDQVYFHRNWPGQVGVARTIEEALAIVERETT